MRKKSQGLTINAIILVAIGLIVLVVLVAIFTGRMGNFVSGISKTSTCENACKSAGRTDFYKDKNEAECEDLKTTEKVLFIEGQFDDVDIGKGCCCKENAPAP